MCVPPLLTTVFDFVLLYIRDRTEMETGTQVESRELGCVAGLMAFPQLLTRAESSLEKSDPLVQENGKVLFRVLVYKVSRAGRPGEVVRN